MRNPFADSYRWSKRIWAPNPFVVLLRKAQTDLAIRIWTVLVPIRSKKPEKNGFGPFSYKFFVCIRVGHNSSVQVENNLLKNSAQATTTGKRHAFASNHALRYSRLGESMCANGVAAGGLVTRGRVALLVLVDENTRPEFYSREKKQLEVQLFPDSSFFFKSRWAKNIHPFEQKVVVYLVANIM